MNRIDSDSDFDSDSDCYNDSDMTETIIVSVSRNGCGTSEYLLFNILTFTFTLSY